MQTLFDLASLSKIVGNPRYSCDDFTFAFSLNIVRCYDGDRTVLPERRNQFAYLSAFSLLYHRRLSALLPLRILFRSA